MFRITEFFATNTEVNTAWRKPVYLNFILIKTKRTYEKSTDRSVFIKTTFVNINTTTLCSDDLNFNL